MEMTDSGAKAMGSLYDLLLDYVDTSRVHDSNYEIAQQLVEHYSELADLSLREMAELCFVSQASFSRFCRFLGFESFAEFKKAVDAANYELEDDYARPFLDAVGSGGTEALETYRTELVSLINATLNEENLAVVGELIDAIEQAHRIVFFSHHFPWQIGRYYQGKMLRLGKYIEMYQSYEYQWEAAETLGENDLAIVLSVNGTFFSHYSDIVRGIFSSGAKVAAITQNRRALYINRVDYVLTCGDTNENDIGKYAALMTIDFLVMSYLNRKKRR